MKALKKLLTFYGRNKINYLTKMLSLNFNISIQHIFILYQQLIMYKVSKILKILLI